MVKPAARRQAVGLLQQGFGLSERGAGRALGMARVTHRYRSRRPPSAELVAKLRALAVERPRFGYRRLHVLLRRQGVVVNHKRVYRLYRAEALAVRVKRRRRQTASPGSTPPVPTRPRQRWSMDFVSDRTSNGLRFRVLTLVDDFSRLSPGLPAERSIGGQRVARSSMKSPRRTAIPNPL